MAGKRKRYRPDKPDEGTRKRVCHDTNKATSIAASHPTLSLYYPQILTLRDYVLSRLPPSSKSRRRKVASIKEQDSARSTVVDPVKLRHQGGSRSSQGSDYDEEANLAKLLDRTLVCVRPHEPLLAWHSREKDFHAFSQKHDGADESSLLEGNTAQSEVNHHTPTVSGLCFFSSYTILCLFHSFDRVSISRCFPYFWLNALSRLSTLQYGYSFNASIANPTVRCTYYVMDTSGEMYAYIMTKRENSPVSRESLYNIRTVMSGL